MQSVQPQPIYRHDNLHAPAFQLRYSWAAWPSAGTFPDHPSSELLAELDRLWEEDGLRRLESRWTPDIIQMTFSATSWITPVFVASRAKGRLQHALRKAGLATKFSRKVSLRSIGNNTRMQVEAYIRKQVDKEPLADHRFRELLHEFTIEQSAVDLSEPTATLSGRYWYNMHLVLVVQDRFRFGEESLLRLLKDRCLKIAEKKSHRIKALSIMPDHLHIALGGNIQQSPQEIALGFLNNLAYALGQKAVWQFGYYAGTFGEYSMNAVREDSR